MLAEMAEIERKTKTDEILAKLKEIPSSHYTENRDLYQELVKHNPDNERYKVKLDYYSEKTAEQEEKRRIEERKTKSKGKCGSPCSASHRHKVPGMDLTWL